MTLTGLRAVAVPFVLLFWFRDAAGPALALYGFVLLSDVADGWAARRFAAVTRLGAILDPVVDIAVVLSLFAACAYGSAAPWWGPLPPAVTSLVFLATIGRSVRLGRIGKYYGAVLYVALIPMLAGVSSGVSLAICVVAAALSGVVMVERIAGVAGILPRKAR